MDIGLSLVSRLPGSADAKHKEEIQVESWSWSENNIGTGAAGGGHGGGKVSMSDFHFTMNMNKASPNLFIACAKGTHIPTGLLTCRKAGDKPLEYLKIKMTDILISGYQTGASGGSGELPVESISLNFAKIEFEYVPQGKDGQASGAAVKSGYDLKKNDKV
jgi:type VI secretion system secreted protein Hcp